MAGLAGGDGAVIGAPVLGLETRPGLRQGWTFCQPLKARTAPADVLRDVTWSGVTVRTDRMPSGLRGHPRLAPRGSCDTGGSLLLHFPTGVFTLLLSGPQNPRDARNGATQLMPGTSNPGLLQVGLALNRDMLHSGTTTPPDSGIGSRRLS
ncbi:uncharacterized protein [Eulemur rufifrons]|uniref:uncharacterized protein n=1 Tax=Eulemur rufifrons TaxID=859984 RepID=UPI003742815D